RDGYIHWAQEMDDQAGMILEIVKWYYDLRNAGQPTTVADRAGASAAAEPAGPARPACAREVSAAPRCEPVDRSASPLAAAAPPAPDATALAAAVRMLAQATRWLIVTASAGRDAVAFAALTLFVERFAIPLVQHRTSYL